MTVATLYGRRIIFPSFDSSDPHFVWKISGFAATVPPI
jgi:hypothetical protein